MALMFPLNIGGIYPPSGNPPAAGEQFIQVDVLVNIKTSNKRVKIELDQTNPPVNEYKAVKKGTKKGDVLRIEKGKFLEVNFHLSPNWEWTFFEKIAFTLKTQPDAASFYLKPYSVGSKKITVYMRSKGTPPDVSGSVVDHQPFNLFMLIEQDQEGTDPMPVMFDPIIKNPPPVGE